MVRQPKLPSTVRIGGRVFTVVQESQHRFPTSDDADVTCIGEINFATGTIRIGNIKFPAYKAECFLHEMMHGVVRDAGLEFDSEDDEETLVDTLGTRLTALIADNPKAFAYLCSILHNQPK